MSISKSLQEVWRWKEAVANETSGMNNAEVLNYFRKGAEQFEKKVGYERQDGNGYYTLRKV